MYLLVSFSTPFIFFMLHPEEIRALPKLPSGVVTEQEKASAVRLGVAIPLTSYAFLFCCVVVWVACSRSSLYQAGFRADDWISSVFRGAYLGMAWAGIWLWMWLILSSPERLHRAIPGLGAPFTRQLFVWLLGAFSEELWRVVCVTALMAAGYSSPFSIATTSVMFAVAFLPEGFERSLLAWLEGVIFGLLFVWQRSFFAPFLAHLAVQAVFLWGVGQFSPLRESEPGRRRGTRCPACGARLTRLQIKIRASFLCPVCRERLCVSDAYRAVTRWASIFAYIIFFAGSIALFYKKIPENFALWLVWPVALGAGTSSVLLYQRVFPPHLQFGEPNFVYLNLSDNDSSASDDADGGRR